MTWSDQESAELLRKFYEVANTAGTMRERMVLVCRFADDIVELIGARGGTMTTEQVGQCLMAAELETPESTGDLRNHVSAQGARVAVLEQSERAWRKRVEAAADALVGVEDGVLGRLDLVGRIRKLKAERDAIEHVAMDAETREEMAESELARIRPSGQVEDVLMRAVCTKCNRVYRIFKTKSRVCEHCGHAPVEIIPAKGRVEGDVATIAGWLQHGDKFSWAPVDVRSSFSRLAVDAQEAGALRTRVEEMGADLHNMTGRAEAAEHPLEVAESRLAAIRERFPVMVNKIAHDAIAEANTKRGAARAGAGPSSALALQAERAAGVADGAATALRHFEGILQSLEGNARQEATKEQCQAFRWCCHSDGHAGYHESAPGAAPWRVKERSDAVKALELVDPCGCRLGVACPAHAGDAVRADDDNAAAESDAYDRGAEAMRAACREAVCVVLTREGLWTRNMREMIDTAIEGVST